MVKIREKKTEDKFDYPEKVVEMNKVLISAALLKPLGFLGAMTTMTITLLMNLIVKSKESKLLYYGQFFHRVDFIPVFSTVRHCILHFYNNKYVITPGLTREVTGVIGICSCHIYER